MSKLSNLIRDIDRMINSGTVDVHEWRELKAKYAERKPTPIPAKRQKARVRKTVVRLRGAEMAELREKRWMEDGCRCVDCGFLLSLDASPGSFNRLELSHIKSRGAGGGDTMENTCSRCSLCHRKSHNAGGKPVPRKV